MRASITFLIVVAASFGGCSKPDPTPQSASRDTGAGVARGDQEAKPAASAWRVQAQAAVSKGAGFLDRARTDGKWSFQADKGPDLGVSALVVAALIGVRGKEAIPACQETLRWLKESQKPDGGIYDKSVAVYVTATAIMALKASADPAFKGTLSKAVEYLRLVQTDEGDGRNQSSEDYGGIGYDSKNEGNLSTSHFAIEAASAAGLKKDDDFYKKALLFLQRCQNRSESNTTVHVDKDGKRVEPGNDGGGIYAPNGSKAGTETLPDGRVIFRSYGSMTYALLKSYLLCDLDAKDPRVKAAVDWISKHWQLDHHPGMEFGENPESKYQGLYYYYLTVARALAAAERQKVDLAASGLGRWREDLAKVLISKQSIDGSWVNGSDRWFEGSTVLVSAYALLVLTECLASP